jgi:hypothetical protein
MRVYPFRWVYVSRNLTGDRHVDEIRAVARTAAGHGLNGMVLDAGFDRIDLQPAGWFDRAGQVARIVRDAGLEIVPALFSAGYGGSVISHDRNLAEGIPVRDSLFVVRSGEARLAADPPVAFVNPGFEESSGGRARGDSFHHRPGEVSFIDTEVCRSGAASMRFENFGGFQYGHGRVMQEIAVRPNRQYRVSVWVKTDQLAPASVFRVQALATDGRALAPWDPKLAATTDWRKLTFGFNSAGYDKVRVYAGVWGGESGRFWVDDFSVEEVGLVNVLRRPGTPIAVRGEASGITYEEGVDFAGIADRQLTFRFDHDGPAIRLLPGSRVKEGERLRVDYYHGMSINDGQVTICMSEPATYEIWRTQARLVHDLIGGKRYLLNMDEIRAGGTCRACRGRGLSMAQILGDCITRQAEMLRDVNPEADISIWSDMLDPNHNAHGDYYLVDGDYTGSWNYIPRDLAIMCWYYAKRRESLAHFSKLGFRTFAGAYYDGDTLDNPRGWLEALDQTPNASGIMYTTWQSKYALLADFGDLVSKG